jgi:hypothetical protein
MQQGQGFMPPQQSMMNPGSQQQPVMASQQPNMIPATPQQPPQMVPQSQPVYGQQPVQGGYVQ